MKMSEFRIAIQKRSSHQSSRKFSNPMKLGDRMRSYSVSASPNVTKAGNGNQHHDPEQERRQHERVLAALAIANHFLPRLSPVAASKRWRCFSVGAHADGRARLGPQLIAADARDQARPAGIEMEKRLVAGDLDQLHLGRRPGPDCVTRTCSGRIPTWASRPSRAPFADDCANSNGPAWITPPSIRAGKMFIAGLPMKQATNLFAGCR